MLKLHLLQMMLSEMEMVMYLVMENYLMRDLVMVLDQKQILLKYMKT